MKITVISPESADARERDAMNGFFAEGLERYHVRKPSWGEDQMEAWLGGLPRAWLSRIVVHGHPCLVEKLGLGGSHEKDSGSRHSPPAVSRSCHELSSLRQSLEIYPSLFFGPVFASFTKKGYGPASGFPWEELKAVLATRGPGPTASVLAIGGVTADRLGRCRELGFDGVAVLGAVWNEVDPVQSFAVLHKSALRLATARHAA
jgi:thiamine-phosphate pyrophosphorylase